MEKVGAGTRNPRQRLPGDSDGDEDELAVRKSEESVDGRCWAKGRGNRSFAVEPFEPGRQDKYFAVRQPLDLLRRFIAVAAETPIERTVRVETCDVFDRRIFDLFDDDYS